MLTVLMLSVIKLRANAECHYVESAYVECMLSVLMLSVVKLSVLC
jgi:hypothetical protein